MVLDFMCSSVGISSSTSYDTYLGLPSLIGRSKNEALANILCKVKKKVDGWKEKFLSQGSSVKGSDSGYPHLLHERVPPPNFLM